jgi:hypothetical protein
MAPERCLVRDDTVHQSILVLLRATDHIRSADGATRFEVPLCLPRLTWTRILFKIELNIANAAASAPNSADFLAPSYMNSDQIATKPVC